MVWHRNQYRGINHYADGTFGSANSFSTTGRRRRSTAETHGLVDWERFRPDLEALRDRERKSNAGENPFDVFLMFKVPVL
jgi:hypothetical protein